MYKLLSNMEKREMSYSMIIKYIEDIFLNLTH